MKIVAILACALAVLSAAAPRSGAEEAKRFELIPHCRVTGWHDDNVDFSPHSGTSDYYSQLEPGMGVIIPTRIIDIKADYTYIRYDYRDRTDLSRDYHQARLDVSDQAELIRNVRISFGDLYELVPINLGMPVDTPYNFTQKNTAYISPRWQKSFSRRNTLSLGYYFSRVDYTSTPRVGEDYFGHKFDSLWELGILRGLTFKQSNAYTIYDYDEIPRYRSFIPMVGLRAEPNSKFVLEGDVGYSFEHDDEGDLRHRGWVFRSAGSYLPSEKIRAKVVYTRDRLTDVTGEPFTDEYLDVRLDYSPYHRWILGGLFRYSRYLYAGDTEKIIHSRIDLRYLISEEFTFRIGGSRTQTLDRPEEEGDAVSNRFFASITYSY